MGKRAIKKVESLLGIESESSMRVEIWDDASSEVIFEEPIKNKKEGWKLAQNFLSPRNPDDFENIRIIIYDKDDEILDGCAPDELGLG